MPLHNMGMAPPYSLYLKSYMSWPMALGNFSSLPSTRAGLFFGRPVSTDVPGVVRLTTGATRWLEAGTIVHPGGFLTC